jgi:glycosyltransferase involved in cell wall biosynthesis
MHNGPLFEGGVGILPEHVINDIYNCADLTLSTALGEGWGFSITEAAAAGCPVACPDHTSCAEIANEFAARGMMGLIFKLPVSRNAVVHVNDNSRVRWPLDVLESAKAIDAHARFAMERERRTGRRMIGISPFNDNVRDWLSWDRIAGEWLKLFEKQKAEIGKQKLEAVA